MTRINVYSKPGEDGYSKPELLGHFDYGKAEKFTEDTDWDGRNRISVATGSQWDHEQVLRTRQGRWVLNAWSDRQGTLETYAFIDDGEARAWLLVNGRDDAVAKHFGEIPEEEDRRGGRPEIGGRVTTAIGDDLLADVDAYATEANLSRAGAIRALLGEALTAARPYTVTCRDISDGSVYVNSRHYTLGHAVEALREIQADDLVNNGLPSRNPRVEHDGRPVDAGACE